MVCKQLFYYLTGNTCIFQYYLEYNKAENYLKVADNLTDNTGVFSYYLQFSIAENLLEVAGGLAIGNADIFYYGELGTQSQTTA